MGVISGLADDAAFISAYRQAVDAMAAPAALAGIVEGFVEPLLGRII